MKAKYSVSKRALLADLDRTEPEWEPQSCGHGKPRSEPLGLGHLGLVCRAKELHSHGLGERAASMFPPIRLHVFAHLGFAYWELSLFLGCKMLEDT